MNSNKSSPYEPLEQSESEFRLLRLLESEANQARCETKSFSLLHDDIPPWKALSYRWGDDEPEFTVYLNNHPVRVRKGLETFLAQMVAEKQQAWYFIDALCIDQDNDLEKSGQVPQMGEIYRRAEEVVAWIVPEPYHIEKDEIHDDQTVYDHDDDTLDVSSLSREQLESFVLENSYWSRLWIVQEVLLAKKLTIRIGSAEVEWLRLIPGQKILEHKGLFDKNQNLIMLRKNGIEPLTNRTSAQNILSYRLFRTGGLREGKYLPFHKAFDFFAMQRCARPHDVVFGYLGLTNSRIQMDYSVPIVDLFVATLADWLLSAGIITGSLTPSQFLRLHFGIPKANYGIAPLLAFKLDSCEPVVYLLAREVTKVFAPGMEDMLTGHATMSWWFLNRSGARKKNFEALVNGQRKFSFKYIGTYVRFIILILTQMILFLLKQREIAAQLKALEKEDAVMFAPGGSGESKTYSRWVKHARRIAGQICLRFIESDEDEEGETVWRASHE